MNREHWDDLIKKAVQMDLESYPQPDMERLWQRIEGNIELFQTINKPPEKKKRGRLWLKIAAVLLVLALCTTFIGITSQVGEALPFGWVFQGLRQFVTGEQTLIQFSIGGDKAPAPPKTPPPPDFEVTEIEVPQTNLTSTTLDELLQLYPGILFYPQGMSEAALKTTQYLQFGEIWTIMMDFSDDGYDILLSQRDILGEGSMGMGFGADTVISFHRLDGVEYMVAEYRYGIVGVKWNKERKFFELTSNLPVDEALALAQSVQPYDSYQ